MWAFKPYWNRDLSNICYSLNLINIHNKPTYIPAELDSILFSEEVSQKYCVYTCPSFDRSIIPHLALMATPSKQNGPKFIPKIVRKVYDLRKSFVDDFLKSLETIDWSFLESDAISLDDKCELFQHTLTTTIEMCIPVSFVTFTSRDKPWITPLVKKLINERWAAFRIRNFSLYNHLKHKVRSEIAKSKLVWTNKFQSKNLWKTVQTHIGTKASNPLMSLLSTYKNTDLGVEAINAALSSIFLPCHVQPADSLPNEEENNWDIVITSSGIQELIMKMSLKKSSDLPMILYKSAAPLISEPLSKLFIESLKKQRIPKIWKKSAITPIPKTPSPSLNDLRPISILPLPAIILEKLILNSVKDQLMESYDAQQFGFRTHSSTLCALTSLNESLTRYLDNSNTSGAMIISYDYSKAFDMLRHDLILKRLTECKLPSKFIRWVTNYLSDRSQYVKVGIHCSFPVHVTSGIPQGSVLGPYLYAVTTSSFKINTSSCDMIKYADDTTLCFPLYKSDNSHIIREHLQLLEWSSTMDLKINPQKCKSLTIKKKSFTCVCEEVSLQNVTPVQSLNILGVTFNNKASWSSHVHNVIRTASRRFFILRVLRRSLSDTNLRLVYFALLRSVLEYCAPLFVSLASVDSNRIDRIQRRFHRLLCGEGCNCLILPSLSDRRDVISFNFFRKLLKSNHVLHYLLPPISPTGRFILPLRRTVRRSKSFILHMSSVYNATVKR